MSNFRQAARSAVRVTGYLASAYCLCALIEHHVVTYTWTSGPSMYPTVSAAPTFAIISRRHRGNRLQRLKIGDIIQADNPLFLHKAVGKRIIGMPGDYVVRDPAYAASVGGAPVPGFVAGIEEAREEPLMMQVPEGHIWAAGDNLSWSRDSRFYGPIPLALIKGKLVATVGWPFNWKSLDGDIAMVPIDSELSFESRIKRAQEKEERKAQSRLKGNTKIGSDVLKEQTD